MLFTPRTPPLITLLTDFGIVDTYVGVMKGVILTLEPQAQIVDLTHEITPQAVLEASVRLEAALPYFPPGTVHVAVVDPGVGTERRICVVESPSMRLIAPDNGLLTLPLRRVGPIRMAELDSRAQRYMLPMVSATFHGRDVFAPVAAHLARGLPLEMLGPVWQGSTLEELPITRLEVPQPQPDNGENRPTLLLRALYVDRFGNIITNLDVDALARWQADHGFEDEDLQVHVGSEHAPLVRTFAEVPVGHPLAYRGSGGRLEIAIRNGNAAAHFGLKPGDGLRLLCAPRGEEGFPSS